MAEESREQEEHNVLYSSEHLRTSEYQCHVKLVGLKRAELNGRIGLTRSRVEGEEERLAVVLFDPTTFLPEHESGKGAIKHIKVENLQPISMRETFEILNMPYRVCRPLESNPEILGGGTKNSNHPDFFPRPAIPPKHKLGVKCIGTDPKIRKALQQLVNGKFVCGWKVVNDDDIVVNIGFDDIEDDDGSLLSCHPWPMMMSFMRLISEDRICYFANFHPFMASNLYIKGQETALMYRVVHHIVRQHGGTLPVTVLMLLAEFLDSDRDIANVNAEEILDFEIACYDSAACFMEHRDPAFYAIELGRVVKAAREAGDLELANQTTQFARERIAETRGMRSRVAETST